MNNRGLQCLEMAYDPVDPVRMYLFLRPQISGIAKIVGLEEDKNRPGIVAVVGRDSFLIGWISYSVVVDVNVRNIMKSIKYRNGCISGD